MRPTRHRPRRTRPKPAGPTSTAERPPGRACPSYARVFPEGLRDSTRTVPRCPSSESSAPTRVRNLQRPQCLNTSVVHEQIEGPGHSMSSNHAAGIRETHSPRGNPLSALDTSISSRACRRANKVSVAGAAADAAPEGCVDSRATQPSWAASGGHPNNTREPPRRLAHERHYAGLHLAQPQSLGEVIVKQPHRICSSDQCPNSLKASNRRVSIS
jgi:hypothetical protein